MYENLTSHEYIYMYSHETCLTSGGILYERGQN